MEIKSVYYAIKCDFPACKNMAKYCVEGKGFLRTNCINICEDCVKMIYDFYSKTIIPKSIGSVFKKIK